MHQIENELRTSAECLLYDNPKRLAQEHYKEFGETLSPYKKGSVEHLEYINEFQKLNFNYDLQGDL